MERFISVIVPVYNMQAYVTRCAESVLAQTHRNIQLILVNDGSTDASGQICDSLAYRDSRVKVIHQKNAGVSAARNAGIRAATGSFIGFVDADDFIAPDMYRYMLDLLLSHDAQIAQCGQTATVEASETTSTGGTPKVCLLQTLPALEELMCSRLLKSSVCNKLYKRELFDNTVFDDSQRVGEDFLINYHLVGKAQKVAVSDKVGYYYFSNPGSCTRGAMREDYFTVFDILQQMEQQETQPQLARYWKLRRAMFAMNFLRRMVALGELGRLAEMRRHMLDARFVLRHPRKYRIGKERNFPIHILLVWLVPKLYLRLLKRGQT